jgi:predicted nucleic acid-binding protein
MVTVSSLEMGVLAAREPDMRARRLTTLRAAEESEALPITRGIAARFAELVTTMRDRGLTRLGVQDAWIAATALFWGAELWTQDADFEAVPGLNVVRL